MTETTDQLVERLAKPLLGSHHCSHDKVSFAYECEDCVKAALREALRIGREQQLEMLKYVVKVCDHLFWTLDLLDMYDARMVQLGDAQDKVYSKVHVDRKSEARGQLEGLWQILCAESPCSYCRDGNMPLGRWHRYASGEELCRDPDFNFAAIRNLSTEE